MNRLIAIGDIHGCLNKLVDLYFKVRPTADDRLVFLGDYIDRGPDSKGVIKYLLNLREHFPQTVFLRGNHEQIFLDALSAQGLWRGETLHDLSAQWRRDWNGPNEDIKLFFQNGGDMTLRSGYGTHMGNLVVPPEHLAFLEGTRFWYEEENFLFVHASASRCVPASRMDPFVLLWSRDLAWHDGPVDDGPVIVAGHTWREDHSYIYDPDSTRRILLDTGAYDGGPLTACDVLTGQVWQAG